MWLVFVLANSWLESNNLKYFLIPHDFTSKCFIYQPKLSNLKLAWFEQQIYLLETDPTGSVEVTNFASRGRKLIMSIGLQYYVNLNRSENFSVRFERQSIISIQSFLNVMGWKQPSNHFKVWNVLSMSKSDYFIKLDSHGWLLLR